VSAADVLRLPDDRLLQLWTGGAASGRAVLFFHGTPDSRLAAGSGAAAARRAGVRLVSFNRPGYGGSDPDDTSQASVADDAVAAADALGIERFAVLGMSIGGHYALGCAASHPERVTAAGVLACPAVVPELDPPLPRDGLGEEERRFFLDLAAGTVAANVEAMRPGFAEYVATILPADGSPEDRSDEAVARRLLGALDPRDAKLLGVTPADELAASAREALAQPDGYLRDAALAFRTWQVRPELVTCPTWLWYGAHDAQVSLRNGRWLAEHVPKARLVVRDDAAHLGPLLAHWDEILLTLRDADDAQSPG
jgi:pimeloyl-ACP methyl ester carboxylesterase